MINRAELLESTLDSLPEGVGLLGDDCRVAFWNQAAQAITGFAPLELVGRMTPEPLKPLLEWWDVNGGAEAGAKHSPGPETGQGFLVHAHHKLGHEVAAMVRLRVLRDALGCRIGTAVLFHPAECLDALPHGVIGEDEEVGASQADLKDRLESLFEDFTNGGLSFGVLWITVDQAHDLRKTHGCGACDAMFNKVERALAHGLRPSEYLGRWGEDEFLVISHERTPAVLAVHAQMLAGLARTADFRWWGDRVSLTVSIGAAQAESSETLADLLERAKTAMLFSFHLGGNHITAAPEGHSCLPS
jgi:diguanylate cyclase (GGDEF)-like protein/PAS domain S-box-containing protein